jgi:hypothetical protein
LIDKIIDFPEAARVNRIISKNKIYDKAGVSNRIKKIFIEEVEQIRWMYKLSPETINIPSTESVKEIQVFNLLLKRSTKSEDVMLQIDKSIPSPILFVLNLEDHLKYVASFKRPNIADSTKRVISSYFGSEWLPVTNKHQHLPVTINLEALFHRFISLILPIEKRDLEPFSDFIQRVETIGSKEKKATRLESKLSQEKQFNRKVEINKLLRNVQADIKELSLSKIIEL